MGMLKKGKPLERKPNPVTQQQVPRNAHNIEKMLSRPVMEEPKLGLHSETERATIKVDNHIRNALTTMVNLGKYESQKDAVDKMCQQEIEKLSDDERKRFNLIYDTLEMKDYIRQQRKKR
jgi:hypothetical protein